MPSVSSIAGAAAADFSMFSEDLSSGSLSEVSSSDEESLSEDESYELELELSSEEDSWTPLLLWKSSSPDILQMLNS